MSLIWQDKEAYHRESWREWEHNLLEREREWEKRKLVYSTGPNLMLLFLGYLTYAFIGAVLGGAVWCLAH